MYRILAANQPVCDRRREPDLVVGYHTPARTEALDVLLPLRVARYLQPIRRGMDARRARERRLGQPAHRADPPQARYPAPSPYPALRPRRTHDQSVHRPAPGRPRRDPLAQPSPDQRRQPLLRSPVQTPQLPPRLPRTLRRYRRRNRVPPLLLPLVQHRAPTWQHRHAHPRGCPSRPSPAQARTTPTHPASGLGAAPRTIRQRSPPSPSLFPKRSGSIHQPRRQHPSLLSKHTTPVSQ